MPRAKANGIEIEYESHGSDDRPAIVLIRGRGTQLIDWVPELIEGFVDSMFRVVAFDNRDAGLSTKVKSGYELRDMADDLLGLLDHLEIDRAHVFGISLGGFVAHCFAYHYPERTRTLFSVMTSSGSPDLSQPNPEALSLLSEIPEGRDAVIRFNAEQRRILGSPGYPESEEQRLAAATLAYERCHCPDGAQRQSDAAIRDQDHALLVAQIRVPTLVIHGKADPLVPPDHGEDTARLIKDAELLLIDGMGHNIPNSLAGKITTTVSDFVTRRG